MELKKLILESNIKIDKSNIIFDEPMKKYTTFKIGGIAESLIKITNEEELKEILEFTNKEKIKATIIGNGSNILVSDKGIRGIVILNRIENIRVERKKENIEVIVGSGTKMSKLAYILLKEEIEGFEELSGIPGTVGGAIFMNAGAHGKEIKDIVKTVKCIDYECNKYEFSPEQLEFGYRTSKFKDKKYIITEITLVLKRGKKEEIKSKMDMYKQYRIEKQPIEYPSAGSTFKRGEDFITAKLIDDAGLKGYEIGGAKVSTKHCGFVINTGGATAEDVLKLTEYIKKEIKNKFNKDIELEIEIIK